MTNADVILAQIRAMPGQTDAELVDRTGIRPHQQVRGICARLEAAGMVRRVKGPNGFIINLPARGAESTAPMHTRGQPGMPPPSGTSGLRDELPPIDIAGALLVIPCSGDKAEGGHSPCGPGLCDVLAATGSELRSARDRVRTRARVDERRLMPAIDRYTGELYKEARAPLGTAIDRRQAARDPQWWLWSRAPNRTHRLV